MPDSGRTQAAGIDLRQYRQELCGRRKRRSRPSAGAGDRLRLAGLVAAVLPVPAIAAAAEFHRLFAVAESDPLDTQQRSILWSRAIARPPRRARRLCGFLIPRGPCP